MKALVWVVVVFVVALGALLLFSGSDTGEGEQYTLASLNALDHVKGNASSTVVLIEYSDFQCPGCRSYYPVLREITQTHGEKLAFVYRHFPLKQIHFNADPAAWASEAAALQGKFWEMHNLLFEKQNEWSTATDLTQVFSDYALLVGLDKEKFLADLNSRQVKDMVNAQRQSALREGFNSTPTFVLNGEKIDNPTSFEAFKKIIDDAVKNQDASVN